MIPLEPFYAETVTSIIQAYVWGAALLGWPGLTLDNLGDSRLLVAPILIYLGGHLITRTLPLFASLRGLRRDGGFGSPETLQLCLQFCLCLIFLLFALFALNRVFTVVALIRHAAFASYVFTGAIALWAFFRSFGCMYMGSADEADIERRSLDVEEEQQRKKPRRGRHKRGGRPPPPGDDAEKAVEQDLESKRSQSLVRLEELKEVSDPFDRARPRSALKAARPPSGLSWFLATLQALRLYSAISPTSTMGKGTQPARVTRGLVAFLWALVITQWAVSVLQFTALAVVLDKWFLVFVPKSTAQPSFFWAVTPLMAYWLTGGIRTAVDAAMAPPLPDEATSLRAPLKGLRISWTVHRLLLIVALVGFSIGVDRALKAPTIADIELTSWPWHLFVAAFLAAYLTLAVFILWLHWTRARGLHHEKPPDLLAAFQSTQ